MSTCPFLLDLETVLVCIHSSGLDLSGPRDRFSQESLKQWTKTGSVFFHFVLWF